MTINLERVLCQYRLNQTDLNWLRYCWIVTKGRPEIVTYVSVRDNELLYRGGLTYLR